MPYRAETQTDSSPSAMRQANPYRVPSYWFAHFWRWSGLLASLAVVAVALVALDGAGPDALLAAILLGQGAVIAWVAYLRRTARTLTEAHNEAVRSLARGEVEAAAAQL